MPNPKKRFKLLKWIAIFLLTLITGLAIAAYLAYLRLESELPDIKTLRNVRYEVPMSIVSSDGRLIAQFGGNKRIPVNIDNVPEQMIKAFLAAEDTNFFHHSGVDFKGLIRASLQFAATGKKKQGGSTITMQVTRNFLITNEKTFKRKLKEIILALKIEHEYPKKKILELYLNQIYMGHSAYGIVAAAQTYYGKTLDELTLAELAMIAGLPKAPSAYNPITNEARALERRNYVLERMLELNYITQKKYDDAIRQPSTAKLQYHYSDVAAPFVAEMVRQFLYEKYGEKAYRMGLKVYTTVDSELQQAADKALRQALHIYDERHGFRIKKPEDTNVALAISAPVIGDTYAATVTDVGNKSVEAKLYEDTNIEIPWSNIKWGGSKLKNYLKPKASIRVRKNKKGNWAITQVPEVEGAFVSMNPKNGAILALSGGFEFNLNKFNRATQAKRQPGSGFKPIIYTTALEQGYTAASVLNDAPISIFDPSIGKMWKPENANKKFSGPTSLRKALTFSRNIIAIQLLKGVGIRKAIETGKRFGFTEEQMPWAWSLALGSGYATPVQMSRMFSVFANGGFLVDPYFIEKIETNEGEVIYEANPKIACRNCEKDETNQNLAPRIITPGINFVMNSMMRDVVRMGTATDARALGRSDIAGKTGTTNDQRDAWFNGFTPTHVASAWVGFDDFRPLGHYETGGVAALPMWIEYMRTALKGVPIASFNPPNDVYKKGGEYIQKGVTLRKLPTFPTTALPEEVKKAKAKAEAVKKQQQERVIKEKPIEALF